MGSRRVIPKHETKDKEEKMKRRRRRMIHIWEKLENIHASIPFNPFLPWVSFWCHFGVGHTYLPQ
jgi:hypothetical protein